MLPYLTADIQILPITSVPDTMKAARSRMIVLKNVEATDIETFRETVDRYWEELMPRSINVIDPVRR